MNHFKIRYPLPLTAALAGLGLGLSMFGAYAETGYLVDSSGDMVKTGSGECWRINDGMPPPVEACGDVIEVAAIEELDSDGDGVPDSKDECPNTPKGVAVDAKGCPKDSDGDGVPDYQDKCPGTPAGDKVDANGCTIIADLTLKVTADNFKFDSSELQPGMTALLDGVIAKIEASPGDETLTIIGHTDSSGPAAYNQGLSERRAQSVADYLIQKGFSSGKLAVSGAGESQPVADNSTAKGREMNRRVEIQTQ